jgi:hypothetical protein
MLRGFCLTSRKLTILSHSCVQKGLERGLASKTGAYADTILKAANCAGLIENRPWFGLPFNFLASVISVLEGENCCNAVMQVWSH